MVCNFLMQCACATDGNIGSHPAASVSLSRSSILSPFVIRCNRRVRPSVTLPGATTVRTMVVWIGTYSLTCALFSSSCALVACKVAKHATTMRIEAATRFFTASPSVSDVIAWEPLPEIEVSSECCRLGDHARVAPRHRSYWGDQCTHQRANPVVIRREIDGGENGRVCGNDTEFQRAELLPVCRTMPV